MKHHNSTICLSKCHREPYNYGDYKWTRPNRERRYVQVLQYVYDHPNCKRKDIIGGVFKRFKFIEGYQSSLFSNMLYDDLIAYDKNYQYTITNIGRKILMSAWQA